MKSEIIEPIIAPQIPIKAKGTASFQFISFLLVYITTEKIAGSMKNIRFIPCACCCGISRNKVRQIIKTPPPPIPSEAKIPEIIPETATIRKFIV